MTSLLPWIAHAYTATGTVWAFLATVIGCLFLDLEMPYKNGLECLVEIRSSERLKDLPVMAFSSTSRPACAPQVVQTRAGRYRAPGRRAAGRRAGRR